MMQCEHSCEACDLDPAQERDPRAYQLALQLPGGATFVASTPEQLYMRAGDAVASEAVAGTRARGPAGEQKASLVAHLGTDNRNSAMNLRYDVPPETRFAVRKLQM